MIDSMGKKKITISFISKKKLGSYSILKSAKHKVGESCPSWSSGIMSPKHPARGQGAKFVSKKVSMFDQGLQIP